jgi:hypothetical protein
MSTSNSGNGVVAPAGTVRLRGVTVPLDSDVGQAFVIDCARNTEGLVPEPEIKNKYGLTDEDWNRLADKTPLLHAVRAERDRRISKGDAAREAGQRHFAKAPAILGHILTNDLVSPRHRIEAAKELRQVAGNGPGTGPEAGEKFIIHINLGGDHKLHFEKQVAPLGPLPPHDGEEE